MKEKTNISMDINKSEFLKMLSAYYTEELGKEVEVKVNLTSQLRGYGYGEYEEAVVEFYFTNESNVGPVKVKVTTTLNTDDIKKALDNILDKLNYSVESIDYKTGMSTVGYYMDEHDEPYFSGVTLKLQEKGIEKVLK